MRKLLFQIVLMILPLAAIADNVEMIKTLTYNFTGVSNDWLLSSNPWGGDENAFWTEVSGYHYWSSRASAIGAHCNGNDYVYTRSRETFPEVIQKVTVNAGAWSDVSTGLRLNDREVSLKTIRSSAYIGNESRIQFDDYVFENVSTSNNNGHLLLEYILSGQADIFIRSITIEYIEGGECDMSEVPGDNAFYAATSFLCERGVLDGSKDDGKYLVEKQLLRKHLANITFRGLFTLKGRKIPSTFVSDQYPGIYDDLKSDAPYYQAAKALLYLDYGDGITPFDRDRDGFFPDGYESRINILKELMEAFNIKPDMEGKNNPFPNDPGIAQLSETSPIRMGYVRQAAKLGIITTENTEFHPFVDCLRGEAFLMLARIIEKIEAGEIADPNPQESDFLDPNSKPKTAEPYAALSNDKTMLTFYYDDQRTARNGMDVGPLKNSYKPSWYEQRESITSVVFDPSFANCTTITRTAYWFYEFAKLTSITGLQYLKTDKVTSMAHMFDGCKSVTSLDVSHFNTANVTDMNDMFFGCRSLTSLDISKFNTANVTDMNDMFNSCSSLTSLDLSGFKTDKVADMNCMFVACSGLTSLDVTGFKTDNVTNMYAMFSECSGLTSLDLSNFNTANVTNMHSMFSSCSGLTSLDLSGFKTDNVTDMSWMFSGCSGLTSLDVSGFNTANVTNMIGMFNWCSNLTSLDVSGFSTNNVTDMIAMFSGCSNLTSLDVSGFSNEKVKNMDNMFYECSGLKSLNLSNFNTANVTGMFRMFSSCSGLTSLDLSGFKTDNVTNMMWMFEYCSSLKTIYAGDGWSTSKVKSSPGAFRGCTNLVGGAGTTYNDNHTDYTYAHVDGGTANPGYFTNKNAAPAGNVEPYAVLSDDNTVLTFYYDNQKEQRNGMGIGPFTKASDRGWNERWGSITTAVFDPSFANYTILKSTAFWFNYCTYLTSITGLQYLKTDHVTDMKSMFNNCQKLENVDLSGFITDNVTDMSYMFSSCYGLESLDLSGFNTSNVTNMSHMFAESWNLTSLDVSGFNTSNVTDMSWLFSGLSDLKSLDVSGFNTSNVTNMSNMFRYCCNMPEIDISSFKTDNVTTMDRMFEECYGLKTIYADNEWSTAAVTSGKDMFRQCTSLVGGAGTTFYGCDAKDHTVAHVDGGADNPGYFTDESAKPVVGGPKPYAVLSENNTVVTFYYDDQKDVRGGMDINNSFTPSSPYGTATTAVFDASFADYRPTSTAYWFMGCSSLTGITGMENLKTENVTNMYCMFDGCKSLTSLDLSSFDTQNVTDMGWMFECCSGLTSLDVTGFNTQNVTTMEAMFWYCPGLTSLDVTHFNTQNVTDISGMFWNCSGLTSLDLSSFDTHSVSDMSDMFYNCSSLTTIYAGSEWSTAAVTDGSSMFYNCFKLKGGAGTTYNGFFGHAYARIDGGTANPGYFTVKAEGDQNGDGKVDEADVVVLVSVVMGGDKNKLADADLNHDEKVDAADIVTLVNMIISQKKEGRQ